MNALKSVARTQRVKLSYINRNIMFFLLFSTAFVAIDINDINT